VVLLTVAPSDYDTISVFDWSFAHKPSLIALACMSLWKSGMRLSGVAEHLGLGVGASVVQRYIAAARCGAPVLRLLDSGDLTWGHVRLIQNLSGSERNRAIEFVSGGRNRTSVRALQRALNAFNTPEPSADFLRYEAKLSEAIQAGVRVAAKANGGYRLEINWSDVSVLQGVLERIGASPYDCDLPARPARSRVLAFELDSNDELDALVGHLLVEN
jgi:hypothetical protein